jgi:hypothetical protein
MAYLDRDSDADSYQGHGYTRVYVEEIGNFPFRAPIDKLMATLRSAADVPVGFRATANPGGSGHQHVKDRYITPAPMGWQRLWSEFRNPFSGEIVRRDRVYIPSRVTDNPYLGTEYIAQLQMVGSDDLVKAWLLGDWDVVLGAFFDCWFADVHVVRNRQLPAHWTRFRAADWGSAAPFSVGWYAVSDGELDEFPRGALIKYREWYGIETRADGSFEPNKGIKLTAEEFADGIAEREHEEISYGVIDPACFAQDGGPSIAERVNRRLAEKSNGTRHVGFRRADNKRVGTLGTMGGWDQLRARLKGQDDRPMIYFMENCAHTIRTLPTLQHDPDRMEDVDTESEDHAPDETRYACMSRPWVVDKPKKKNETGFVRNVGLSGSHNTGVTFSDMMAMVSKAREGRA